MRKIILIVIATLLLTNIGFAEMRLIEEKKVKGKEYNNMIYTVCIDGYKFVFMRTGTMQGRAQAITQAFEERDGKSLPKKC